MCIITAYRPDVAFFQVLDNGGIEMELFGKISIIKLLRAVYSELTLKECKEIVDDILVISEEFDTGNTDIAIASVFTAGGNLEGLLKMTSRMGGSRYWSKVALYILKVKECKEILEA